MTSNNFDLIKNNNSIRKNYLVRMNPARDVTDSLTPSGSNKWSCTIDLAVNMVTLNGVKMASSIIVNSAGKYNYNSITKLLTIYSGEVPGENCVVIVYHYLFFTNDFFRYISQDPISISFSQLREWQPRLIGNPSFSQTVENIIQGNLSISSSTIQLKNHDNFLKDYLGMNDSFYNKPIEVWLMLDGASNIKKIFEGVMTEISTDSDSATFQVKDILSKLQQPAVFGTPSEYQYYKDSAVSGFTVTPNKSGGAIPLILGKFTNYSLLNAALSALPLARKLDPESLLEAQCTLYSSTLSGTTNRAWGMCLSLNPIVTAGGTVKSIFIDNSNAQYTKLTFSFPGSVFDDLFIGDQVRLTNMVTYSYLEILYVDYVGKILYLEKNATPTSAWFYEGYASNVSVYLQKNGVNYRLKLEKDFNIGNTAIDDTNGTGVKSFVYLVLFNNLETTLGISPIDPTNDRILFRCRFENVGHGETIKRALDSAGIKTNGASFAQADLDLPVNCNFSIPYFDETETRPYYGYIEDILKSTLGYLRLNSSFEVEYKLFRAPVTTEEITDVHIEKNSLGVEVKYKDLVSEIIAYNSHFNAEDISSKDPTNTPSKTLKNNRSKFLHDFNNTERFRHVLDNIVPTLQNILAIRSERRVNYVMRTHNRNIDSMLGDEFIISSDKALASPANTAVIVSIDEEKLILSEIPL